MGHIRPCVLRSASAMAVVLLIPTLNSNSAPQSNTRSNADIPTTARPAAPPTTLADEPVPRRMVRSRSASKPTGDRPMHQSNSSLAERATPYSSPQAKQFFLYTGETRKQA